ncbi:hypothetical protein QBC34DRAFT_288899 [Podospora aff. communis PSN243]|uniref:C2 domain-containing protein n=1 Tax=Podospora aff. communis PSN243 TaxID=3040156 RepID=A0AAV9H5B6_9PEZI|nr:hypothetical protein QBC34DRAFT_288899 [Podospora aff. communis PSN243]
MASLVQTLTASGGAESPGFINDLIKQLWPNIIEAAKEMIPRIAGDVLRPMGAPLSSVEFKKADIGPVPIHISNVDVHQTENNGIKLDVDVDWDGKCDFELVMGVLPQFGVEHIKLRGRLSILLSPLMNVMPLVGAAQVTFINEPHIDLEFTDAAHIANIGFIDRAVRKIIVCIIGSMAILPNRFLLKLDPANDYYRTYLHPLGVLRVTVESAEHLGEEKEGKSFLKRLVHDEPDCFVKLKLSAEPEWQTKTVKNHRHPEWNETHDIMVYDYDQILEADVQDQDTATGNDDIGVGKIAVKDLLLQGGRHVLSLTHNGQPTDGKLTIRGEFHQFVPDATSLTSADAASGGGQILGLMSVLIASVRNLSGPREQLKPSVRVYWGDAKPQQTGVKSDCPGFDIQNPGFDQALKFPLLSGMVPGPPVRIVLVNGQGTDEVEVGEAQVSLDEVLAAQDMKVQRDFDVGNGVIVKAAVWLRGTTLAQ